ncbi:chlorite dismutase family protein [Herbiconiux sp. CPCC 203407]|uniref:Coproheme decarboxylase n=1 Tax=Herbiconiux oxytropis TaxID=2970915 RepID=A0AA41XBE3_9MICO|nr:hydrogen peroxide-dependent heme synthase [Herbiconiux oxytropis]MCS5720587.1 chlorite dismutase family protein [Herbiconiux oxytropis]MCS5725086.1 chlorite dismutase family protein [Herbiconiux oxytropis]
MTDDPTVAPTETHIARDIEGSDPVPVVGYTLWAVFRRNPEQPLAIDGHDVAGALEEVDGVIAMIEDEDVMVRGIYDVSGLRSDADIMVWLHGSVPETLQWALRQLRRTSLFVTLLPTWNAMGVHRDAEFSANHLPAFMRGKEPAAWLTVYPFVRSYEWYILPEDERRRMLAEHGRQGAQYRSVLTNTVASFALGDYEWILALEDDDLLNLVDLMRHLRATDARLHVREEVPFYTGRRIEVAEIVEVLQ